MLDTGVTRLIDRAHVSYVCGSSFGWVCDSGLRFLHFDDGQSQVAQEFGCVNTKCMSEQSKLLELEDVVVSPKIWELRTL